VSEPVHPYVTDQACPCGKGFLIDYGPESPDLLCDDPNCVYDPFESGPVSPIDEHDPDDPVTHPNHYTRIPGVEVWDVLKYFPYLRGNSLKYLLRAGYKTNTLEDLRKAQAYIQKEIEELERGNVRVSRMYGDEGQ